MKVTHGALVEATHGQLAAVVTVMVVEPAAALAAGTAPRIVEQELMADGWDTGKLGTPAVLMEMDPERAAAAELTVATRVTEALPVIEAGVPAANVNHGRALATFHTQPEATVTVTGKVPPRPGN